MPHKKYLKYCFNTKSNSGLKYIFYAKPIYKNLIKITLTNILTWFEETIIKPIMH